jgi:natural product biosynthesis luciferase-like monooxygenase protein
MSDSSHLSCFLIGSDTLLTQCGETLLRRGHAIRGVITAASGIEAWAKSRGLTVLPANSDYAAALTASPFDFLFSITYLEIIPDVVTRAPARLAINFHDGPLPAYAGLNAPMWALMNGETDYAITWHALGDGIDTGDILLQQPVAISPDDTALSLNTKCFAAAIESFPTLLDRLEHVPVDRKRQDLSQRSYFSRHRKPAAAGLIDWTSDAQSIEQLVRGLHAGNYPNPLAAAKLLVGNTVCVVESARAQSVATSLQPGAITVIEPDALTVCAGNGMLRLTALRRLDGRPLPMAELVREHGLTVGSMLPALSETDATAIARLATEQNLAEAEILRALTRTDAIELPYRLAAGARAAGRVLQAIALPAEFCSRTAISGSAQAVVGAFIQFLGRVLGTDRVQLAVVAHSLRREIPHFDTLFASHVFVDVALDADASARDLASRCLAACEQAIARGPWLRDLIARQPALHGNRLLEVGAALPVVIAFGDVSSPDLARAELVLRVHDDGTARLESASAWSEDGLKRLADRFSIVLEAMAANPDIRYRDLNLLSDSERKTQLERWNATSLDYDRSATIQGAFAAQVARTPGATAVTCRGESLSYAALNERADALAVRLRERGVGPGALVGVHVPRSIDLVVATLAVLKSGGAYVPLDPAFPKDRLEFMIADSAMKVIVTHSSIAGEIAAQDAAPLRIDALPPVASMKMATAGSVKGHDLAYVIYTSGSTGRPKGVMVEHRNAINFFAGMDAVIPRDGAEQSGWLAVTSLSFDISILELLWTLTRGFKVIVHDEAMTKSGGAAAAAPLSRQIGLGLFMWGNDDAPGPAKYRLLMEGAKYFDENGFAAVWTPERHFHAFGGPYPNPAVTGAAVAAITSRVKIRAGSCVMPLHHPIRIAEEWAVVDNLSNGRVEISAASGWNPNDFVLRPENHANNKDVMLQQIEQVRRLWRGEKLAFPGPFGKDVEVQSLPRPVQAELPVWVTTAGNPDTWRAAGQGGFHVLTHLLGQTVEEVGDKIRIYREARAAAGFDPATGQVALMLHTFLGDDDDAIRELVRAPMKSYLASSMRLAMNFAWSFPAFKRPGGQDTKPEDIDIKSLSADEVDTILDFAFDRYFSTSGLFGTVDTCLEMLRRCAAIGVTEIACLLDFGVETERVMQSLPFLKTLRDRAEADVAGTAALATADYSFAGVVSAHHPTHMQCTPSMARMYLSSADSARSLKSIPNLLLGGEALPVELVRALNEGRKGRLINMYGPTETTIWSTTDRVDDAADGITIGRPIANTCCYVLDKLRRPVPVGLPGELFIGGDGVARGYLNRPELTAERFLPDPFAGIEGARMYATGDLARYREDGRLEYIGRADFQVKIRGYRIELGEIEALLESRKDIAEAAVVVRAEDAADVRLAGFVVAASAAKPDAGELRAWLREKLPDYMVPADIAVLPAMPRTANGKLDRKALTSLRAEAVRVVAADAAPQDELQKTIAKHWQQVLKLDKVGIDENFFDLGGHSLLVVQLHNQLKQALSAPLSLTDLYQYPTIRTLCAYLSSGRSDEALQKGSSRGAKRRALRSRSG